MRSYTPDLIHNVGLFGHGGCGKTTLTEALLFSARATSRLGRVEDGSTVSDHDPDEQQRGMSINLSVAPVEWQGNKINLIDTPGYADFAGDMAAAMRVLDGAVLVLDATGGVEVGTELAWELAKQAHVPRVLFLNKVDRDNANFARCIEQAREVLDEAITPLQIPIGEARDFRGVISLRQQRAYFTSAEHDGSYEEGDVPAELDAQMHAWRSELIDKIAATNDDLIEKYLEGGEDALTREELLLGLQLGIANGSIVPVFCGSAAQLAGMAQLLSGLLDSVPPASRKPVLATHLEHGEELPLDARPNGDLAALVFKTIADSYGKLSFFRVYNGTVRTNDRVLNSRTRSEERLAHIFAPCGKELTEVEAIGPGDIGVTTKLHDTTTNDTLCGQDQPMQVPVIAFPTPTYTSVVRPQGRGDLDKLGTALHAVTEEDPTLHIARDSQTGETLLSGLGDSHLRIVADRMLRKYGVHVDLALPQVPYRETVRDVAEANYRHKKQTGGAGQFADVSLRVEPLPPDPLREDALEFVNEIVGGVISRGFMPAIEKGIREAMADGLQLGAPVVDVRVAVFDGKEHPVDSKEIAFKTAATHAFKLAAAKAQPVVLEPIYLLEITVPEAYAGDIMGDISTRRGRVQGMLPQDNGRTVITAYVPLGECQRYATDLRSMTQARGRFTMQFVQYEDVPAHLVADLIARRNAEQAAVS